MSSKGHSSRSSVTTGGNRSTRRKPAMFGRDKLDNTLLTCDKGNLNQITARSRNRTLVIGVGDTCTTTVSPAPRIKDKRDRQENRPTDRLKHNLKDKSIS